MPQLDLAHSFCKSLYLSRIYSLSERAGYSYDEFGNQMGTLDKAILRRYDSNGTLVWLRDITSNGCNFDNCYEDSLDTRVL